MDWLSSIAGVLYPGQLNLCLEFLMKLLAHLQPLEHTSWIELISLCKRTKQCAQDSTSLLSFFFSQGIWSFGILVSENYGANINWSLRGLQSEHFRKRTKKQIVLWIELIYSVFGQISGQITGNYNDKILIVFREVNPSSSTKV